MALLVAASLRPALAALLLAVAAADTSPGDSGCKCEAVCGQIVEELRNKVAQLESEVRTLQGASAATRRAEAAPCSTDWQITSDADVETHRGCREARNITIEGDSVTSLAGLQSLESAENIFIRDSPKLKDFTGLEGLSHVRKRLEIQRNARLSSLGALQGLQTADEILINDNSKLTSLAGLQGLQTAVEILINDNSKLTSLAGLQGLQTADQILINANSELMSLAGLQGLQMAGYIEVARNPKLMSLNGVQSLTTVGTLYIHSNAVLTSLSSFESLTSVAGDLKIKFNDALEHVSGFELLERVENEICIVQNSFLKTVTFPRLATAKALKLTGHQFQVTHVWLERLQSVNTLESRSMRLELVSAPNLHTANMMEFNDYPPDALGHLTVLENLTSVDTITFGRFTVGITGFNSLVNVTKQLKFQNTREDPDYIDLTMAFQNLQHVNELLCIYTTARTFPTFSSLTSMDKLVLLGHSEFESFTGLASLKYLGNFTIRGNKETDRVNIRSLAGFESLVRVGFFEIEHAEKLPSLAGLESLTTVAELTLDSCSQLADMTGLESLTNVGVLTIKNCARVASLSGLEHLQEVGAISLTSLGSLQSLDAFQHLTRVGSVSIENCNHLRSVEGLGNLSTGLLHVKNSSLEYLGGPFAATGASANVLVMDGASWPRCITPHERMALVSKVNTTPAAIPKVETWPSWGPTCNRPNYGTLGCTRGHPCAFSLAGHTGYTSVFISARFGGCGLCSTERRPQAGVMEEGTVNFGYTLTNQEGGLYSVCRCAGGSAFGPVAQLALRGPRKGNLSECIRGRDCTVKLDGEMLERTDHVELMSHCAGNTSLSFTASWATKNVYRLHNAWYNATPARYQVCWRAPCSSSVDGPTCPAPEDTYLNVGEVDLRGAFTRHYTVVLGDFLEVPNIGLVSDGDWMRLRGACGKEDEEGFVVLEAESSKQLFDFGQLTADRAGAGSHRLCWCPGRDGAECTLEQHFVTEAGTVRILCPTGQELVASSRRCQGCRAGRQRLEPGLEPCSECPTGQFSLGGGAKCGPCPPGRVAEMTGSSDCVACQSWESADAEARGCSADPTRLGLLFSFCMSVGTLSALLVRAIQRRLPLLDVSLDHDRTIVTTFGSHNLSNHGRSSFPVTFCDTGHPGLDRPSEPFRAIVRDAARLELVTWGGKSINQRLDTSMGRLLVASPHDLYHQGWPVPVALSLLVLFILVVTLGGLVLDQHMALEGSLGAAATAFVFALASAGVRWRPRTTPLAARLQQFKQGLNKQPTTYCEKGPNRALAVGKLHDVLRGFRDFIQDRSAYFLDSNILRPLTKEKQVSYAELVGAEPVEWFVSHFWGTAFEHFCMALQKHAETACGDRQWTTLPYWVCFCANNQYKIQEELGAGWEESSFFLALKCGHCRGTCMVLDDQALPLTRIWCIFELLQTCLLSRDGDNTFQGLLLCTSGGVLNTGSGSVEVAMALAEKVADMDLASARASSERDALMIRKQVIADMGSFGALKGFVRGEVRSMLTCAQTNANQHFAAVLAHLDEEAAFVPV